jgi:hypothetical protein
LNDLESKKASARVFPTARARTFLKRFRWRRVVVTSLWACGIVAALFLLGLAFYSRSVSKIDYCIVVPHCLDRNRSMCADDRAEVWAHKNWGGGRYQLKDDVSRDEAKKFVETFHCPAVKYQEGW